MSFQTPKPINMPGPGKRPGVPGKFPGQPGARPGLPKPKNPTLIGGKPMVPISSLIQFTPKFDPEVTEENPEPVSTGLPTPSGDKINGIHKENIEDQCVINDKQNIKEENGQERDEEEDNLKGNLINNREIEVDPEFQGSAKLTVESDLGNDPETKQFGNNNLKTNHLPQKVEDNLITFGIEQKGHKNLASEGDLKSTNDNGIEEENKKDLIVKNPEGDNQVSFVKQSPFNNNFQTSCGINSNNEKDEEENGSGDQSHSPVMRERKTIEDYQEGRSTQDDPREYGVHDDPSSGLSHETKTKDLLEAGESDGEVLRYSHKGLDFKKEEDSTLLAQLKALTLELEKEKKEKNALKVANENIMNENIGLKTQLVDVTHQLETLQKKEKGSRDLARKEEEIKRLKGEIKSTMEGSRLITEHSNRVISESTKFKEETEILIANLEKDKEDLHKRFIEYKKEAQLNYISKLVGLQEKIDYLQNKNREYEIEIERYQDELKQKANNLHKLAQINSEMQSTLAYWPTFYPPQPQPTSELKTYLLQDQELVLIEDDKSPVVVSISKEEVQEEQAKEEKPEEVIQIEKIEQYEQRDEQVEEETINIQTEQNENFKEEIKVNENAVNVDLYVEPEETQYEKQEEQTENLPISNQHIDIEENQNEPISFQVEENMNNEPIENGWGVEEPIIENEVKEQEVHHEMPIENNFTPQEEEKEVENHYVETLPSENETLPTETFNEEPPKIVERQEIEEEKPMMNNLTAPPSNRLLQKKKKGGPPPRQFVGFKPTAAAFESASEPTHIQAEETHKQTPVVAQTMNEKIEEKPPMSNFGGFRPPVQKTPTKRPNFPPQFSQPFLNKPQQNLNSEQNGHHIDATPEHVQPLQEEGISVEFNVDTMTKATDSKTNVELDRTSNTSFEQRDSSRKMSYNIESNTDLDGNETQENKPKINGHTRPVKISKAIKKKEPATGSIFT